MKLIITLLAITSLTASAETHNHKAHVHGNAKLTLAIEDEKSASIDLDVAGDSIMGFEHEAKSEKDKKAKADGFNKLREQAAHVIEFDPALKCITKTKTVEIEKEEKPEPGEAAHGEHSDVNASYTVTCESSLNASNVRVGLMTLFPKIKKVSLQILTSSKQSASEVTDALKPIQLP